MQEIKIVNGLNWGDESKGLVANAVSTPTSLTIFTSNSCQRGHTVMHNGERIVFRNFGTATVKGAATYYGRGYMINPVLFREEYEKLVSIGITPTVYCNSDCRIITPLDMYASVQRDVLRGEDYHGTTGCGVWESRLKWQRLSTEDNSAIFHRYTLAEFSAAVLNRDKNYYLKSFALDRDACEFYNTDSLYDHILNDIAWFKEHVTIISTEDEERALLHSHPVLVFENSQGLLLDDGYSLNWDYNTPDRVDACRPLGMIADNFYWDEGINVEVLNVTRTYFTRHGAGPMGELGECNKSDINPTMIDTTNQYNSSQKGLRYGIISNKDVDDMVRRINANGGYHRFNPLGSVVITHTNEYEGSEYLWEQMKKNFRVYESDNETDIKFVSADFE